LIHFYKRKGKNMADIACVEGENIVTPEVRAAFERDGYILVRGLLTNEEVDKIKIFMEGNADIMNNAHGRSDGHGARVKVSLWNHPGDDVCGMVARCEKVAGTMQELLGGQEIYHYHSKLIMKDAKTGGAHIWHQDYGYWYQNGCLFPDMGTVFLPVDRCTKENSCLQVLVGSHRMGRVEHTTVGEQAGADLSRVEMAKTKCEHRYIEMNPGDGLFFHCNLLHTSDQNKSDLRRWVMISSYNQARNDPTKPVDGPVATPFLNSVRYTPMQKVANSMILGCSNDVSSSKIKDFMTLAA